MNNEEERTIYVFPSKLQMSTPAQFVPYQYRNKYQIKQRPDLLQCCFFETCLKLFLRNNSAYKNKKVLIIQNHPPSIQRRKETLTNEAESEIFLHP